jgi:hypothetical protein
MAEIRTGKMPIRPSTWVPGKSTKYAPRDSRDCAARAEVRHLGIGRRPRQQRHRRLPQRRRKAAGKVDQGEPAADRIPDGLRGAFGLADAEGGRQLSITLFDTREAIEAAEPMFEQMGDEISEDVRGRRVQGLPRGRARRRPVHIAACVDARQGRERTADANRQLARHRTLHRS